MVNNFTNINKTNNHLSPKLIVHKKIITYDVGDASLGLGQARKVVGLNRLMGSQSVIIKLKSCFPIVIHIS
jgi:hypothetical protein